MVEWIGLAVECSDIVEDVLLEEGPEWKVQLAGKVVIDSSRERQYSDPIQISTGEM